MNIRYHEYRKMPRAAFLKKILDHDIIVEELCQRIMFFRLFSKTIPTFFFVFCTVLEDNDVHFLSQIAVFRRFNKKD